jgi:hypothetical protein
MFGVHRSGSADSFPPRWKDRLLLICVQRVVHVVYRNKKCLTVPLLARRHIDPIPLLQADVR